MKERGYELYWEALSGAIAPQVMFEEMEIPYKIIPVDMEAGEHEQPEYLSINPTGQVPALRLPEGIVIGESAAMVLLLGERHPEANLVPLSDDLERPVFLRWLLFMAASMYMTFVRANHPERFTTDDLATESIRVAALRDLNRDFRTLEDAISKPPYILNRGFSALDIYLCMLTVWCPDREAMFSEMPKLNHLCHLVEQRPAYARVIVNHI